MIAALRAYNERSAKSLENIADRIEGKTLLEKTPVSAASFARLMDEVPLLREIDRLTTRLASEDSTRKRTKIRRRYKTRLSGAFVVYW